MTDKQEQKSGNDSVNIQATNISIGITYDEARKIALDVFDSNFHRLAGQAAELARERAVNFSDNFLRKLAEKNPDAIDSARDPDMQYALFNAQKDFARTGDKDLGDILIDILIDRASQNSRSLQQIVLSESLTIAPKLTPYQFDILSLIFLIRYTKFSPMGHHAHLAQYIQNHIVPFISDLRTEPACYQHLEYAGCGSVQISQLSIEGNWRRTYPGLFWKGMTKQEADELIGTDEPLRKLVVPCLNDGNLFQFRTIDVQALNEYCKNRSLSEERTRQLISTQDSHLMNEQEVKTLLSQIHPEFDRLVKAWDVSDMKRFTLTSVGIAIAHANIKRKINDSIDLSIWIN